MVKLADVVTFLDFDFDAAEDEVEDEGRNEGVGDDDPVVTMKDDDADVGVGEELVSLEIVVTGVD